MIEIRSVAEILGLGSSVGSLSQLDSAVAAGLPKRCLERLSLRLCKDPRAASAYKFTIVPAATWKKRSKRLSAKESAKTERLARALAAAEYVWDDREDARAWMGKPHPELDGQTPVAVARTELGARRVEHLLARLFFGLPV